MNKYGRIPNNYRSIAKGQHGSATKRHQQLVMELHKKQLECQQLTQLETELQRKQLEELHVNSFNG